MANPLKIKLRDIVKARIEEKAHSPAGICERTGISQKSLYGFLSDGDGGGILGDDFCDKLTMFLFEKKWFDVVQPPQEVQPKEEGDIPTMSEFRRMMDLLEKRMSDQIELLGLRLEKQIREHEHPFQPRGKHQKG